MIKFRLTNQNFEPNTFIARKRTPIDKTLNDFGYIKSINNKGIANVLWFNNYRRVELTFKLTELKNSYKSIYPYYNTKVVRGNIWKYSYLTLLSKIYPEKGFTQIKVDKMTYKKNPNIKDKVMITDAKYVLDAGITDLNGYIRKRTKNTFTIHTNQGEYIMTRNSFALLPQDYFVLLNIRCN